MRDDKLSFGHALSSRRIASGSARGAQHPEQELLPASRHLLRTTQPLMYFIPAVVKLSVSPRQGHEEKIPPPTPRKKKVTKTKKQHRYEYTTDLEQVNHLRVKLGALGQRVEDQVVDASDAVAVEEVGAPRVKEQVAVPSEKTGSRSSHLKR